MIILLSLAIFVLFSTIGTLLYGLLQLVNALKDLALLVKSTSLSEYIGATQQEHYIQEESPLIPLDQVNSDDLIAAMHSPINDQYNV